MNKFLTPLFLAALLAVFTTSCSSSNNTLVGLNIELTRITRAADGSTQVTWRVVNPNVISYLVAHANHRIYAGGTLLGTVNDKEPLAVPAQSQAERTGPLAVAGADAVRTLAAAQAAGSAAYRTESEILIQLYGEMTEKDTLKSAGTVPVTAK